MRPSICTLGNLVVIALGLVYMTLGSIGILLAYATYRGLDTLDVLALSFWLILFMGGCAAFFTETHRVILRMLARGSMRHLSGIFD